MKKRQKVALWVFGGFILLIIVLLNLRFVHHVLSLGPSQPPSIDNIHSAAPIKYDMVTDEAGDIHLVWRNEKNNLAYQKSTDGGKTWINIRELAYFNYEYDNLPKILSVNGKIVILWAREGNLYRLLSDDKGVSWGAEKKVMVRPPFRYVEDSTGESVPNYEIEDMSHTAYKIFKALTKSGSIYLLYSDISNFDSYFARSDDYGESWSKAFKICSDQNNSSFDDLIDIQVRMEYVHILYRNTVKNPDSTGIFYFRSSDNGNTWINLGKLSSRIPSPKGQCFIDSGFYLPKLIFSDNQLHLVYSYPELIYTYCPDNGSTWSVPSLLNLDICDEFSLYSDNSGELIIPYITSKHQEKDWWGYLSVYVWGWLNWNDEPGWGNNDLYCAIVKDGRIVNNKRLTHQLSYVQTYEYTGRHSFTCLQTGRNPILFWAGKRKVGKHPAWVENQSLQNPYEIFFKEIK